MRSTGRGHSGREARNNKKWKTVIGEKVEVWLEGEMYRHGLVDDVMPDGSGLWLASEGPFHREYVDVASGFEVRTGHLPGL
ncbi:hypothetical protein J2Y41_004238 [Arthrobacter sp. 1088]|uniref:hypothetical protein n=1 Tax=Arthrobacter sp. 1088 TaxID=2817768 RepID=UPI0028576D71|nr:hypothetical protein [Arthrobacter sp. 1088]MDR6688643.1 hypothetical protein [Arthrobacter sp. 1088]